MLKQENSYAEQHANFDWQIPAHFNIAVACCERWADGTGRRAIISEDKSGGITTTTFDELKALSNQAANMMLAAGVKRGDRVAIFLPQCVEVVITHMAAYKIGAITVPLFSLFGPDALQFRLGDSGVRLLVTDMEGEQKIRALRAGLPALESVYCIEKRDGVCPANCHAFWDSIAPHAASFTPADTLADDPAVIIYTSGTTGKPKGALHAHRVLLGHLPGVEMSHDFFPQADDLMWTPADWAWIGGLLDVLMPALYHGVPVLARRFEKFEPAAVFDLMARHQVRNVFFPPTALKILRAIPEPKQQWPFRLRSVASGGESLGDELINWGRQALGVTINEFYGQTECNMVVSSCAVQFERKAGTMGRAAPGHDVKVVDEQGVPVAFGVTGNIAIHSPDPVMFLGYWNNPSATADKFAGGYLLTGDLGQLDEQGYIRYIGRDDDVITSAGYRIGPGPIEECLLKHRAVRMAAVIGKKDAQRTEIVKAFIVLNDGYAASSELVAEIQDYVRTQLAAHEYPREISFLDALPATPTGKIMRKVLRDGENG
ncbi:acyl-CoA synthetase [Herbaspirillum sp. RTI4]|uniref:acyl-CoA synthetase n=1 Tax=Herbaspirillum sp. RTI4 TaxID=3048640 RepID=UPI002AB32A4D|nr:acyl-CoA synthetase [Herbaspirillum sp. RTI4]MDY7576830.1 acyl-CoA synthetase [Herbaspirillum sp. RTI4]MEA9981426.1 acyl-CoA synthetase [Herbaspirillum sp. RTI4]